MINPLDNTPKILSHGSGYFQVCFAYVAALRVNIGASPAHHPDTSSHSQLLMPLILPHLCRRWVSQYHIKIVPTIYEPLWGSPVHTNQYSYTELFRTTQDIDKLPAVYFHYELSPIMAKVTESRRSYSSFLTGLCAIAGGVFTVAGLFDSMLHRINRMIEK